MQLGSDLRALLAVLILCLPIGAIAAEGAPCPAAKLAPVSLPHVKQALSANKEVTIVALGSSSTAGFHASDAAHSYPAILQEQLQRALPTAHVVVLSRGVGGQD